MMLNRKIVTFVFVGVFVLGLVEGVSKGRTSPKKVNELPFTFKALGRDDKTMVEYVIRRIPETLYEKAGQFSTKYCLSVDTLCVSLGMC